MTVLKRVVGVVLFMLVLTSANAQVEKFQSLFIYNFSRYIKWPDDMSSGQFVIGVLGNSSVYDHLKEMADTKKKTQNMDIVVKRYNSVNEVENCHILFVSSNFSSQVGSVSSSPKTSSTLIVTDKPGLAKRGATINFIEDSGKIKFELNQSEADQRGLKVAGSLSALSVPV